MHTIRKVMKGKVLEGERYFHWRGGEISRIEALTDAVIALAMTLLIVSLQVPASFDEMMASFAQIPAFAVSFTILVMCWHYHYQFHRRYGLENLLTVVLNAVLLFLILLYVYPLRFLFTHLFAWVFPGLRPAGVEAPLITGADMPTLMLIYSGGFVAIFALFAAMSAYAYRLRDALELDEVERAVARSTLRAHLLHVGVGLLSIAIVLIDEELTPFSGIVYFVIGPVQGINGWLGGREIERLATASGRYG